LVGALLLAAATACGSANSDDATSASAGNDTVSVTHRYGTTEVAGRPQRIVSLDMQWTDVLIAMGQPPIGYISDYNVEGGSFPWRGDALDDATAMKAVDALPWEQIAALEPDLIVVTYFAQNQADYDRLSAIAPTVAGASDAVDTWQQITQTAGQVLREPEKAQQVIADVDATVAKTATELPGLQGKTFALVNYVPGDAFYVVADPGDGASVLFSQLGMSITPTILNAGGAESGRVELSLEQTSMLDADLLIFFTNGAAPDTVPGYAALPAVQHGAVVTLDYTDVTGLNTPTPLSVPYSLEKIRPALEAAAA
jgi:iron complex transport system substrate-binding protein